MNNLGSLQKAERGRGSFLCWVKTKRTQMLFRAYLLGVFFTEGFERHFSRTFNISPELYLLQIFITVPVPPWYSSRAQACGLSVCFLWWSDYRHLHSVLNICSLWLWSASWDGSFTTFCSARHGNKVLTCYKLKMVQYFVPRLTLLGLVGFSYRAFQLLAHKSLPDILNTLDLCRDANETAVKRLKAFGVYQLDENQVKRGAKQSLLYPHLTWSDFARCKRCAWYLELMPAMFLINMRHHNSNAKLQ